MTPDEALAAIRQLPGLADVGAINRGLWVLEFPNIGHAGVDKNGQVSLADTITISSFNYRDLWENVRIWLETHPTLYYRPALDTVPSLVPADYWAYTWDGRAWGPVRDPGLAVAIHERQSRIHECVCRDGGRLHTPPLPVITAPIRQTWRSWLRARFVRSS